MLSIHNTSSGTCLGTYRLTELNDAVYYSLALDHARQLVVVEALRLAHRSGDSFRIRINVGVLARRV